MRVRENDLELAAWDLAYFAGCRHRTALDRQVADGSLPAPFRADPTLEALQERGRQHEEAYVDALREDGVEVEDLGELHGAEAVARTEDAMRRGVAAIVQPSLRHGRWGGRPDVLRRINAASSLGEWSYEVVDTKLAAETSGRTVLQLCVYSWLLEQTQGLAPQHFHVVTPATSGPQSFRVNDFAAYFRAVRARLEAALTGTADGLAQDNYPEPVPMCDFCRWWNRCDARRREDDHLSLVAGIARLHRHELESAGIETLRSFAEQPVPLSLEPRRGSLETFERLHHQARLQLAGRGLSKPVYELLPLVPGRGLSRLPEPCVADVFLDLEGDPFGCEGGREYLFGLVCETGTSLTYSPTWAYDDASERAAFEAVVDSLMASWAASPGMHVYHYAPYDRAAFQRLMSRYGTREAEIDRMLRAGFFVDLHAVVKHAVRAGVERYSIKDLEPLYGFERGVELRDASRNLRVVERALELGDLDLLTAEVRAAVEGYNREDCESACRLRAWLESLRDELVAKEHEIPRPSAEDGDPPGRVDADAQRVATAFADLTAGVPPFDERSAEEQVRWLLAHLLDWHRREEKVAWWEHYRLRELDEDELREERPALAGLVHVKRGEGARKAVLDTYRFPPQESDLRRRDDVCAPGGVRVGKVEAIDRRSSTVTIRKVKKRADEHPAAVFAQRTISQQVLRQAMLRIGEDVASQGLGETQYQAGRDLLLRGRPRVDGDRFDALEREFGLDHAVRVVQLLDRTCLPIQGPPGSGKTFTGARMILALVAAGKRVGVTAVSHKVIRNLLDMVVAAAEEENVPIRCAAKVRECSEGATAIDEITDNVELAAMLESGDVDVVGATAFFWAREQLAQSVDVLVIDEAGQMSLANALVASQAGRSLVLLGDPQQLEQPQQGHHPEGAGVSALDHVLDGGEVMPADRGIFLSETRRLAPEICEFTSELFYGGRLKPIGGLERQRLTGVDPFSGAGLWYVPAAHDGNQNASLEEVEVVEQIVSLLLRDGSSWTGADGQRHPLTAEGILVVAPYNVQVSLLEDRLEPRGVRVGTVDRFQGQEAPVVVYSMATSRPEDAPRGLEFLYSLNRFNVATSRARCGCILVASPRLLEPECRTPRHMRLANVLCSYVERAATVAPDELG